VTEPVGRRDAHVLQRRSDRPSVLDMNPLRRARPLLVLTTAAFAATAMAGCGNGVQTSHGGTGSAISAPTASPTASATATSTASAAATPRPTTTASAVASARPSGPLPCAVSSLRVGSKAPRGGASAGSSYLLLTFRNASSSTCTMNGHPGVSFVGRGNGTQLGSPAVRSGGLRSVELPPGRTTTALVQIANAADYDAATCEPTTSNGLRVYPPDSRASVFVRFRTQACQATGLQIPQLSISAVGGATDD
jgi:hypothetical protein